MMRICLVSIMWGVLCWSSLAQTNDSPCARPVFSISASVRPVVSKPLALPTSREVEGAVFRTEAASSKGRVRVADAMSVSTGSSDPGLRLYRRLEQSGNLNLLEPMRPRGSGGIIDAIFEPDVIHLGRAAVSGSIITAYKRKNPLCLLNPIFFDLSW